MPGYFNAQSLTDAVMRADGFMDTGDMGYLVQGEVVITGRSKDMILHKGRNVWPEDLEWAAEKVAPLTDGDVAAFGVDLGKDDEEIILLVQARSSGEEELKNLRQRVAAAVSEAAGVSCKVVLVRPKTLTFTSSGKLSRSVARDGYIAGTIDAIDFGIA
jgi:fatty-acyl-CoA synthase